MHGYASALARGIKPRNHGLVVAQNLCLDVGWNATHRVVSGWENRHRLGVRLDTKVGAGELGDVWKLGVDYLWWKVGEVEQNVVFLGASATTLANLVRHGTGNHVTRGKVFDGWGITLHEALARSVAQNATLTTGCF